MMTKNQEHTRTLLPTDRSGMNRPLTLSLLVLTCALGLGMAGTARGADDHGDAHAHPPPKPTEKAKKPSRPPAPPMWPPGSARAWNATTRPAVAPRAKAPPCSRCACPRPRPPSLQGPG